MLAARLTVVQVLDHFQVGIAITEFAPGVDPVTWTQSALQFTVDDLPDTSDALTIVLRLIALWSERTIQG